MKKLTDRIDNKAPLANVQAAIPEAKKAAVEAQFAADTRAGKKVNWRILVEAMCDQYLEERYAQSGLHKVQSMGAKLLKRKVAK